MAAPAPRSSVWPFDLAQRVYGGFSDAELERLCEWNPQEHIRAPWLYHVSEMYSLGKCLRANIGWPQWLPLPVYSDHGAVRTLLAEPHELHNAARVHLTWNRFFLERNRTTLGERLRHVRHPWVDYRRARGYRQREDARGTLVFFAHSGATLFYEQDVRAYLSALNSLPDVYRPFVFCVHANDVARGLHLPLREAGVPLVTVGSAGSRWFVDRFYGLAGCFRFGTSNAGGSELAYLTEMGIPYFLFGPPPALVQREPDGRPVAAEIAPEDRAFDARKHALFDGLPPQLNGERLEFAAALLGLDSTLSAARLRWLLCRELLHHAPLLLRRVLRRIGLMRRPAADSQSKEAV